MELSWEKLHAQFFGKAPEVTLDHLAERCRHLVSEDHAHAHEFGIWHPEVVWSDIMRQALPAFATLSAKQGEDFLYQHIQLLLLLNSLPNAARIIFTLHRKGGVAWHRFECAALHAGVKWMLLFPESAGRWTSFKRICPCSHSRMASANRIPIFSGFWPSGSSGVASAGRGDRDRRSHG